MKNINEYNKSNDPSSIEFHSYDGDGNKVLLDLTKYGKNHIDIQIIDKYDSVNEETKFFILTPDKIEKLKDWLSNF